MTDPHAPPPDLEDLFRQAREDVGEPERLARVATKLPIHPSLSPWFKVAGIGSLIATLGLVGSTLRPPTPSTVASPVVTSAPVEAKSVKEDPITEESGGPPAASAEPPAPSAAPPPVVSVRPPPPIPRTAESDPVEEHALLAEARRTLGSSPAAALDLVQRHQQRFPRGELGLEREFLRIQALSRLGRSSEARAAGERFLRSFPRSAYAAEIERLIHPK